MKEIRITSYEELVNAIDRGDVVYMYNAGPMGKDKARVIDYMVSSNAYPDQEWLDEEGFANEMEWLQAYEGVKAIVLGSSIGPSGTNTRILDSVDVEDFDIYYKPSSVKGQEMDLDFKVPDADELHRLLRKLIQRLNWHRELFDKVENLAIEAVKSATRDEPKDKLKEKAVGLYYATIDLEAAHGECRNILKTTDAADELYDILKKLYKS